MNHILYHHPCPDGLAAAAIAIEALGDDNCLAYPADYNHPCPLARLEHGRLLEDTVYLLDFCYDLPTMQQLVDAASKVIVLDHHPRAADIFGKAKISGIYDPDRSGCQLAWDHFFNSTPESPRPSLVEYIGHRDLGLGYRHPEKMERFHPKWKQVHAALWRLCPHTIAAMQSLIFKDPRRIMLQALMDRGDKLLYHDRLLYTSIAERPIWIQLAAHPERIPATDGLPKSHVSDGLHWLLKKHPQAPFAAWWTVLPDGRFEYSLRSLDDNPHRQRVGDIAKSLGGGGHPLTAGFTTSKPAHLVL